MAQAALTKSVAGKYMKRPVSESLKDYARGIAGGLLFSFPLLYTMEMWWAGFSVTPQQLLLLLFITYVLLLGYNRYAGMRPAASWAEVAIDSVEVLGIGLVVSFAVLLLIGRIDTAEMDLQVIIGKIILEAVGVSIGVSIGKSQLDVDEEEDESSIQPFDMDGIEAGNGHPTHSDKIGTVILAICGTVVVGGNVAPTEEVLVISLASSPADILLMALVSLLLTIVIVYFSDFKGSTRTLSGNILYYITFDACMSYLLALGTCAFILWFFGRFENVSFWVAFAQCIVLGVIGTLGASAGRLLIK